MMLSSTHFFVGSVCASRGIHLSPCNPTLVLSNATHMVSTINACITTLSCDGSSSLVGNKTLQLGGGENVGGYGTNESPYKP